MPVQCNIKVARAGVESCRPTILYLTCLESVCIVHSIDNAVGTELADADRQCAKGEFKSAAMWARKSLAYSVGILHADYHAAQNS